MTFSSSHGRYLQPLDGEPAEHYPFLAVARSHIVYVVAPAQEC
jgi:hypothetical protein